MRSWASPKLCAGHLLAPGQRSRVTWDVETSTSGRGDHQTLQPPIPTRSSAPSGPRRQEQPGRRRWPRHGRRLLAWLLLAWLAAALVVHCRNWWVGRIGLGDYPPLPISWPARQPARRAELLPFVVANHSSDACVEVGARVRQPAKGALYAF